MPPEPFVLGFDTSAAHCAAALLCGSRLLTARQEQMEKGQAERLIPLLEELLAEGGIGWGDLSAIGVGIGPGNFTGIRIAVSAARGLALALNIPSVGVSAFEALALGLPRPLLATVDARRDMIYGQVLEGDAPAAEPFLIAAAQPPSALCGSGIGCVGACAGPWADPLAGPALSPVYPPAEAVARIASERFRTPLPRPAPLYLRSADAAPPSDLPPVLLP
ncbi:tRNA (adenosine(37)-N6)-threonylcarbamoyltransferase complex dimerization subunit type 1 TsaB [Plastorhodobacter daqingensis]|uniref:tRNA (Adenosine(37)-N6)-threonylcarbamoyltransferase complex dimerization subunit type 1 TsaB n=1 Tax=Plastorhodobacter daqingensis TaxID=1387281 RepID=A0ABW2UGP2_9RHOB